jgi:hypothetical protein
MEILRGIEAEEARKKLEEITKQKILNAAQNSLHDKKNQKKAE